MNSEDINKKIKELGINPQQLSGIFNSQDGKKFAQSISKEDKQRLINTFLNMDSDELKNKLKSVDLSRISSEDILKKLR